jgi:photosystem II stability/assembly factor-like uncharacterized protein
MRRHLDRWFGTLLLLGLAALGTAAWTLPIGEGAWERTAGPPGGSISCVAVDLDDSQIVYAAVDQAGIYRSLDGGRSWIVSYPDIGHWIADICSTPHGVFASHGHDWLLRSSDQGATWQPVSVAPERRLTGVRYGVHGDVLLAKTEWGQLYASRDGGRSWRDATGDLPQGEILDVGIAGPEAYWAAVGRTEPNGLYRSTDGGRSWRLSDLPQIAGAGVRQILIANDDPSLILVGFHNVHNEGRPPGVSYSWISRDGGDSWAPHHGSFDPDNGWWPLAQGADGALYVNNANHIYRSNDRGRTWWSLDLIESLGGRRPGDISRMVVDPNDADNLYVAVLNGVAASRDGGRSWTLESEGILRTRISLVAADPIDPNTIYAADANGGGTYRTIDGGDSWTWLNGGGLPHPWVDELLVHPTEPSTVYQIVDVADVYRSRNGGDSWSVVWEDFRFSSVVALAPSPSDPDVIYACKNGFGLFKSEDGGDSWRFLHHSEIDYTYTIAVHPEDANVVLSGSNPKPFQNWAMIRRSTDGGTTWSTPLRVDGSGGFTSIAFDPSDPRTVYATSIGEEGGNVYVSQDTGISWALLNEAFTMCTVWGQPQLVGAPNDPNTVYAATWLGGTWRTVDAGASWRLLGNAPISATSLAVDALHPAVLFLGDRSSPTVWRSTDGGDSWQRVADFASDGALLVMRVLVHDGVAYAATFHHGLRGGDLYRSTDNGAGWERITGTLPKGILDIAIDPRAPNVIYVTTNINGAYVSNDSGDTWAAIDGFPDVGAYDIEIDPFDSSVLYASARGGSLPGWFTQMSGDHPDGVVFGQPAGVYRSTDGGETWAQILETWPSCRAVRVHPDDSALLFAVDLVDGLLVSHDGGATWTAENAGIETIVPTSLVVAGERLYIGTQGCGVWSADLNPSTGALSWRAERSNRPVPTVYSAEIRVDPNAPQILFVAAYPGGLMRSTDGGATWRDRNGINPSVVVDDPFRQGYYSFAIDPTDSNEMWLGTWGKGVYRSHDAMLLNYPVFGADRAMLGTYVYAMALDPNDPSQVYVASEQGVYHTSDDGATWQRIDAGLPTPQVRTLAFTTDGRLLAGTLGYGLHAFDRRRDLWEPLNAFREFGTFWPMWSGRPLYQYSTLLIDPTNPETMYVGTFPSGVYKTTDGGAHWVEKNVGWTNDGVFCLVFHPDDTDVLYSGTYNGVNRSLDGGEHWELWDAGWPPEQWVFHIAFDPVDPNVLYACSKNGENEGNGRHDFHGTVMKSVDGGAQWTPITDGLDLGQEFLRILVDPVDHRTLYLATSSQGVWISRNAGASWREWNEGLDAREAGTNGNNVANVLTFSADGRTLYFGTLGGGVWKRSIER